MAARSFLSHLGQTARLPAETICDTKRNLRRIPFLVEIRGEILYNISVSYGSECRAHARYSGGR
jgi:hypothetical protein